MKFEHIYIRLFSFFTFAIYNDYEFDENIRQRSKTGSQLAEQLLILCMPCVCFTGNGRQQEHLAQTYMYLVDLRMIQSYHRPMFLTLERGLCYGERPCARHSHSMVASYESKLFELLQWRELLEIYTVLMSKPACGSSKGHKC